MNKCSLCFTLYDFDREAVLKLNARIFVKIVLIYGGEWEHFLSNQNLVRTKQRRVLVATVLGES